LNVATVKLEHQPFQKQLAFGRIAESQIAMWLRQRGWIILPIYDIEYDTKKGPRLYSPTMEYIAPDLLTIKGDIIRWIEAKHKTVFTWYRKKSQWETGIDARHFEQYQEVTKLLPWDIWLLFLHGSDGIGTDAQRKRPSEPWPCPSGLFGNKIDVLVHTARYGKEWGRGMYYWSVRDLLPIATMAEMTSSQAKKTAL